MLLNQPMMDNKLNPEKWKGNGFQGHIQYVFFSLSLHLVYKFFNRKKKKKIFYFTNLNKKKGSLFRSKRNTRREKVVTGCANEYLSKRNVTRVEYKSNGSSIQIHTNPRFCEWKKFRRSSFLYEDYEIYARIGITSGILWEWVYISYILRGFIIVIIIFISIVYPCILHKQKKYYYYYFKFYVNISYFDLFITKKFLGTFCLFFSFFS